MAESRIFVLRSTPRGTPERSPEISISHNPEWCLPRDLYVTTLWCRVTRFSCYFVPLKYFFAIRLESSAHDGRVNYYNARSMSKYKGLGGAYISALQTAHPRRSL